MTYEKSPHLRAFFHTSGWKALRASQPEVLFATRRSRRIMLNFIRGCGRELCEAFFRRSGVLVVEHSELGAVPQSELFQQGADVVADCALTEIELFGNFLV